MGPAHPGIELAPLTPAHKAIQITFAKRMPCNWPLLASCVHNKEKGDSSHANLMGLGVTYYDPNCQINAPWES